MRGYNIAEFRRKRPTSPASSMMIAFDMNTRPASIASSMMDKKNVRKAIPNLCRLLDVSFLGSTAKMPTTTAINKDPPAVVK